MARNSEMPVLRLIDETPVKPEVVVRLTTEDGALTRIEPVPITPLTRLEPLERSGEELRTHEPDYESLAEAEVAAQPLEETWNDANRESKPVPWGWFACLGIIFAGGAIWSMAHLVRHKSTPEAVRTQAIETRDKEYQERAEAEATVDQILKCVRTYCQADTIEKLCTVVRQPERVRPLMEDWYRKQPLKAGEFETLDLFQPMTFGRKGSFWMVSCTMKDGQLRHLMVEETEDGSSKVDWETDVCYQPMDWDQYVMKRPAGSMDFRIRVEPDILYSHEFSDSNRWACFRLSTLTGEETLYGYVERDSELGRRLTGLLRLGGNQPAAMLLRISTPAGLKSPHGVMIEKLMSPRWTYVDPPDT